MKDKMKIKEPAEQNEPEFSPKVEKIYKMILRIMSTIIGVAIVTALILPLFEVYVFDVITQELFRAGLLSLVLVILIEIFGKTVKTLLSKIVKA